MTARLAAVAALVLVPLAVMFGLLLAGDRRLSDATRHQRDATERMLVATESEVRVLDIDAALRGYALTRDDHTLTPLNAAFAVLPDLRRELLALSPAEQAATVERLFAPILAYMSDDVRPLLARLRRGERTEAAELAARRHVDEIRARLHVFVGGETAAIRASMARAMTSSERSKLVRVIGLVTVPLLLALAAFLVSRYVTRPIRRVAEAADRLSRGELDVRVDGGGIGEVSRLANSFNAMAASMQRSRDDLEAQNRTLDRQGQHLAQIVTEAERNARMNRAILEAARDGYLAVDENGVALACTAAAAQILGHPAEDVIGHVLADVVLPPDQREREHARRRALLAGDLEARKPFRLWTRTKDGRPVLVEMTASAVTSETERLGVYFVRDVTDVVRREDERRAEEAATRALAEAGRDDDLVLPIVAALGEALGYQHGAFFEHDGQELVLHCTRLWSEPACRQPEAETRIRTLRVPTAGCSGPCHAPLLDAWHTGAAQWTARDAPPHAGLPTLPGSPLRSEILLPVAFAGEVLGVLVFITADDERPDASRWAALQSITALMGQVMGRRRAELEADRAKTEFFALLSHELRTPLTSVLGYLDLVRDEEAGALNEEQLQYLAVVERNARRLERLVGDLLFVAQIESGKLQFDLAPTDLSAVVDHGVEAARPRATLAGVTLVEEAEPVTIARGDADRLGQLVDNLLSNAIKFTPDGGTVRVAVRREGSGAAITVTDDGPGIEATDLPHLFERFYRTEEARHGAVPGLGLGLSICQAIADGHGGRLSVESTPGVGTTFRVELPS